MQSGISAYRFIIFSTNCSHTNSWTKSPSQNEKSKYAFQNCHATFIFWSNTGGRRRLVGYTHYDGPKFVHTDEMELIVDKLVKLLPAVTRELNETIGRLENKRNTLFSDQSTINFVCPDIKCLRQNKAKMEINCSEPGLIVSNIDSHVGKEGPQQKGYIICLFGKKLTIRFGNKHGEVDLYGHETAPTLTERIIILREEEQMVKNAREWLNKTEALGAHFFTKFGRKQKEWVL